MNTLNDPVARNWKPGWYDKFRKHVALSSTSKSSKLVLIGDSIISNFDKCNDIFNNFFSSFGALNFGISGDKIQNVLWRMRNMTLPSSTKYVIIHCGTNNLGHNSPIHIAEGLINLANTLKNLNSNIHVFISCLLPRDNEQSTKRALVYAVNSYLKEICTNFHLIDLDSGWTLNNQLNNAFFRHDNLHLNRNGYEKLSKLFLNKIKSLKD